MVRSGLILGVVMLIVGGILAFLFPLCVPCLALVAGAGAGYLAAMWDRPLNNSLSIQRGAGAGAIAGVGALLGHVIGGLGAAAFIGQEGSLEMMRQFGLDLGTTSEVSPAVFYASATLTGCCFGLFEVALMAALGAVGGILWWNMTGKNQSGMSATPGMPA
jgi:hypothetical protein